MTEITLKGKAAKKASYEMITKTTEQKNEALLQIAKQLLIDQDIIIEENKKDLEAGREALLPESTLDRIMLNKNRIKAMSDALLLLVKLKDPVGETLESITKDNGLRILKKRVPLGVIGMIYEARPNVTVDAATLSIKTGNSVILKGSSSAKFSNAALVTSIHHALEKTEIPKESVQLIEDNSREAVKELFTLNEYVDVLIPRGGKNLIQTVLRESTVPVLETGAGNCHLYIDDSAKLEMAQTIALNAKVQRPSVCNAIETILIHKKWFEKNGKQLVEALEKVNVKIYGDEQVQSVSSSVVPAIEEDWYTEYIDLKISMKVITDVYEAIDHINKYGTKHSEAIVTEEDRNATLFLTKVDAAAVYHNASTRFTDGFEYGYGAEIGISTQKLHARGPMGLQALTSSKFFVYGTGQIRN